MYQINVPAIYSELTDKSMTGIKKVLAAGTTGAAFSYILAGIFGFIAFTGNTSEVGYTAIFEAQNILMAPYGKTEIGNTGVFTGTTPSAIYVCLFGILIVVSFATPFCVLPSKDSIEEVRGSKFSPKENVFYTALIVAICCAISCCVLSIGTIMTILGATTNPAIGFLLPIAFYLQVERKKPRFSNDKIIAYLVFAFVTISSIIELVTFFFY